MEPVDKSTFHADYQGQAAMLTKAALGQHLQEVEIVLIPGIVQLWLPTNMWRLTKHLESDDAKMGSDLVFYCLAGSSDPVKVRWNDGQSNVQGVTEAKFTSGDIKTENGVSIFTVNNQLTTNVHKQLTYIKPNKYFFS
jgi:hypothetical protein